MSTLKPHEHHPKPEQSRTLAESAWRVVTRPLVWGGAIALISLTAIAYLVFGGVSDRGNESLGG